MRFLSEIAYKKGVAAEIRDLLATTKIVVLTGCREPDLLRLYDGISDQIGSWAPMEEDSRTGRKTGAKWIDVRYDPQFPNSYRHSSTRQPLHTDGSYETQAPQISLFYCIRPAAIGGATTFIDSETLLRALEMHSKELFRACCDIPITFAKGNDSKTRPIITNDAKGTVLTWNYFRVMETTSETANLRMEFHKFLEDKIVEGGLCVPCQLETGDAVFFHDERLLHGRNSFIANRADDRFLNKCGIYFGE